MKHESGMGLYRYWENNLPGHVVMPHDWESEQKAFQEGWLSGDPIFDKPKSHLLPCPYKIPVRG